MAKANLVDRIDVIPGGKCAEISHPRFLDATHSVQQHYRRSLTGFEVADVLTEGMAAARARYYNRTSTDSSGLESDDIDEMANLREQL